MDVDMFSRRLVTGRRQNTLGFGRGISEIDVVKNMPKNGTVCLVGSAVIEA
jgi:hypothetical protein